MPIIHGVETANYCLSGKDAREYLGMEVEDDDLEEYFYFTFDLDGKDYQPEGLYFDVKWSCHDTDETGLIERVNNSSGFSLMMCGWEIDD